MLSKHEFVKHNTLEVCAECGLIEPHVVHHAARSAAKRSASTLKFHVPNHGKIVEMAEMFPHITVAQVARELGYSEDEAETELRHCTRRGWVRMSRASNPDGSFLEFRWVRDAA